MLVALTVPGTTPSAVGGVDAAGAIDGGDALEPGGVVGAMDGALGLDVIGGVDELAGVAWVVGLVGLVAAIDVPPAVAAAEARAVPGPIRPMPTTIGTRSRTASASSQPALGRRRRGIPASYGTLPIGRPADRLGRWRRSSDPIPARPPSRSSVLAC
jgi:hypothetical protein